MIYLFTLKVINKCNLRLIYLYLCAIKIQRYGFTSNAIRHNIRVVKGFS